VEWVDRERMLSGRVSLRGVDFNSRGLSFASRVVDDESWDGSAVRDECEMRQLEHDIDVYTR